MKAAARSITWRTGVSLVPIISYEVISAPSQWVKLMMSAPAMPGKKYLLPPEKPTTSCGNTGPQTSRWSYSSTSRLRRTGTSMRQPAARQRGDLLGGDVCPAR